MSEDAKKTSKRSKKKRDKPWTENINELKQPGPKTFGGAQSSGYASKSLSEETKPHPSTICPVPKCGGALSIYSGRKIKKCNKCGWSSADASNA